MKYIKELMILLLIILIGYRLVTWFYEAVKPDYWMGVYYPVEDTWIYSTKFQTKEECAAWAQDLTRKRPQDKSQDIGFLWECNKNCKLSEDYEYLLKNSPDLLKDVKPSYICDDGGFDDGDWER